MQRPALNASAATLQPHAVLAGNPEAVAKIMAKDVSGVKVVDLNGDYGGGHVAFTPKTLKSDETLVVEQWSSGRGIHTYAGKTGALGGHQLHARL